MSKINRIDDNWLRIDNSYGVDATILANSDVEIDRATFVEIDSFLSLNDTLKDLSKDLGLEKVVFSPDLHKGAGIPVGTSALLKGCVIPKAIGTDIGCGMQLSVLDVPRSVIEDPELDQHLRAVFFEGKRNIKLSRNERIQLFKNGAFTSSCAPEEFLRSSALRDDEATHDDQLGSIGGGNHFVEIQEVDAVIDRHKAYEWGLKKNSICIMSHTGSVSVGQYIGKKWQDYAKNTYSKALKAPKGEYFPLIEAKDIENYLNEMRAAANFAAANRSYLTSMVKLALYNMTGVDFTYKVLHDSAHNLAWDTLHRKGACPAELDKPVIVPGSMGDYSYVLCGHGNIDSLCSACHGAGRKTARKGSKENIGELSTIRIITKLDPKKIHRKDILADYQASLAEEAPSCYKDVVPAIDTCKNAKVASPVIRLKPILTIKGY